MDNALRSLALLACSVAVVILLRTSHQPITNDSAEWLFVLAAIVPFVMAVLVAWRGHDR